MTGKPDLYTNITNQIIAAIEGGANGDQWVCPWRHSGSPVMRPTSAAGRRYSGINRLILWAIAERYRYSSGIWATFQQWKDHGGQVRKGEKGAHVVLWKRADTATNDPPDGEATSKGRVFARTFCVFNKDQVEGVDPETIKEPFSPDTTQAQALEYLKVFGVPIIFGRYDAYYRPDIDQVFAPNPETFTDTGAMLATISHELIHATGHKSRENRVSLRDYHKDRSARALEELVPSSEQAILWPILDFHMHQDPIMRNILLRGWSTLKMIRRPFLRPPGWPRQPQSASIRLARSALAKAWRKPRKEEGQGGSVNQYGDAKCLTISISATVEPSPPQP